MKLISAVNGTSAIRMSADDFTPPNGIPINEISQALVAVYKCTVFQLPPLPALALGQNAPLLWLQNGQFEGPNGRTAILNIVVFPNGLWVSTQSATENADAVLANLIEILDRDFGFKIASIRGQEFRVSNIVVEFGEALEKLSRDIELICEIANKVLPKLSVPFQLKRFTLGHEGHDENQTTFDNVEWADFSIERRVKTPYAENRFYCTAPTSTSDHVRLLGEIESSLGRVRK